MRRRRCAVSLPSSSSIRRRRRYVPPYLPWLYPLPTHHGSAHHGSTLLTAAQVCSACRGRRLYLQSYGSPCQVRATAEAVDFEAMKRLLHTHTKLRAGRSSYLGGRQLSAFSRQV